MRSTFRKVHLLFFLTTLLLFSSCTAYKKVGYLKNVDEVSTQEFADAAYNYQPIIMPNDVLSITVNTPTAAASKDFNMPLIPTQDANELVQMRVISASTTSGSLQNYMVNNEGEIKFPILGKIKIGGLTKKEAEQKIYNLIYPRYVKEEPIVNIRFLNYKVAVLGEVNRPGVYTASNEQLTLFDALALAGDLTIYGRRNNVLLIRESADGQRKIFRINMQDKGALLANDTYYLQQNDKIYVEPNRAKGNNSQIGGLETLSLSAAAMLISLVTLIKSFTN